MNSWDENSTRYEIRSGHSAATSPKSDSFMSASTYFQTLPTDKPKPQPPTNDETIMARYVMACVELERFRKIIERQNFIASPAAQAPADYQLLKIKEESRTRDISHFKGEVERLQRSIRQLEQASREKDRSLSQKDEEIRAARQEASLNQLGVSKAEVNERNRIRELENELLFQKSKSSSMNKRKEEVEHQLKEAMGKEQIFVRASADYEIKIRKLEQELKNAQLENARESTKGQQAPNSILKKELQQLRSQVNEHKFEAERHKQASQRVKELELETIKLRKETQQAVNRFQVLEIEMRNNAVSAQVEHNGKGIAMESELATLRRTISTLQGKLKRVDNDLAAKDRQLQSKIKQCELATKQGQTIRVQLNELIQGSKLQSSQSKLAAPCKDCPSLKEQVASLLRNVRELETELRLARMNPKQLPSIPKHKQNTELNHYQPSGEQDAAPSRLGVLSSLLLSAQHIKHSNERVDHLIETSLQKSKLNTSRSQPRTTSRPYRSRYY